MCMIGDFQGCGAGLAVELGFVSSCPGHVPATSMRNKLRTSLPGKRAQAPQFASAHFQATPSPREPTLRGSSCGLIRVAAYGPSSARTQ